MVCSFGYFDNMSWEKWFLCPNIFNKLEGHIALGPSVIPFVRPLQKLSYSFEIS